MSCNTEGLSQSVLMFQGRLALQQQYLIVIIRLDPLEACREQ